MRKKVYRQRQRHTLTAHTHTHTLSLPLTHKYARVRTYTCSHLAVCDVPYDAKEMGSTVHKL